MSESYSAIQGAQTGAALSEEAARALGRERMNIVIVGHVDHGKSTVIGRLLADTGSLPDGKLAAVRAYCERNSKPFEYAFLMDALKDEQAQGITIDTARTFFKSPRRDYIIIDAPGHIEFLKNMVTGAARAEAALLVIDAKEGIQENSKRHGYLLSMLGIRQIAVVVNKMDLVGYDRGVFEDIRDEYMAFLARIGATPRFFMPIAAFPGDNLVKPSPHMPWFKGPDILGAMDAFEKEPPKSGQPFRLPVQDVYKFTAMGDDRRIVAGRVESGTLKAGDEVIFHPSGKRSKVAAIEGFNRKALQSVEAGASTGVTLTTQVYVGRGEIMARADEPTPCVGSRLRVDVFWMGRQPLTPGKDYFLKLGTAKVPMRLEKIEFLIDASETQGVTEKTAVERHDVADCVFSLRKTLAFDPIDLLESTGRFVIVDGYEIAGGGIIREALPEIDDAAAADAAAWKSLALGSPAQGGGLVVLAGSGRESEASDLETRLRTSGHPALVLGLPAETDGNDATGLGQSRLGLPRPEALARLATLAWFQVRSGAWAIVSLPDAEADDLVALETFASDTRLTLSAPAELAASPRWTRLSPAALNTLPFSTAVD